MDLLKQSTAATIKMGPFLDDTDGKTAETGLTISQADIRVSKNGGAFAQTNNAAGASHDENGYYGVPLDTTDTGTLGRLRVAISESGALPVWADFLVVPTNVYDSLVLGTDYLQSDAVQVEGSDATDQINAACDTALTDYDAVVPADLPTNFADLSITATTGRVDVAAVAGTAQTANDNGADINAILEDTSTTIPGTITTIDTVVDAIKAVTDVIPDAGALTTIDGKIDTIDGIVDNIVADTGELQTDWTNGGRLDLLIDAILEDTGTTIPGTITTIDTVVDAIKTVTDAIPDSGALTTLDGKIDTIDGIVDDILIDTNEIQGDTHNANEVWDATSATLSLSFETMLDRIYRFLMNKMNITDATGSVALRNEADSANIATQTVTDDDTTTTRTALSW